MADATCRCDPASEVLPWALAALLGGMIVGGVALFALGPALVTPKELKVDRDEFGRIIAAAGV